MQKSVRRLQRKIDTDEGGLHVKGGNMVFRECLSLNLINGHSRHIFVWIVWSSSSSYSPSSLFAQRSLTNDRKKLCVFLFSSFLFG